MGKRRRNTNTRRKRQYESRMRGAENALMREAKLVDPQTITGMTLMSVAELEADQQRREAIQSEREQKLIQEEELRQQRLLKKQNEKKESVQIQTEERRKQEESDRLYLESRKPNYWERKKSEPEPVGWWKWIFG
jgi:hypothetical protein